MLAPVIAGNRPHLIFAVAMVALVMAGQHTTPVHFRFEDYDRFLGLGGVDQAGAQQAFIGFFPAGTPLDVVEKGLTEAGADCRFHSNRDEPHIRVCLYAYPKYRFLPIWPMARTWSIDLQHDPNTGLTTGYSFHMGLDGP